MMNYEQIELFPDEENPFCWKAVLPNSNYPQENPSPVGFGKTRGQAVDDLYAKLGVKI